MAEESIDREFDRRALIRKAAIAGAIGWTTPVILTTKAAAAGVFTAKCAPGNVTATPSFVRTACGIFSSTITITILFSGTCPCGGGGLWCSQKNSPTPTVSSPSSTLSFSVTIPVFITVTITGKVALGCTDRDLDTQYAIYNWSMTASDSGAPCNVVADSISAVTLSGRTLAASVGCPSLAALTPAVAPAPATGATRTT